MFNELLELIDALGYVSNSTESGEYSITKSDNGDIILHKNVKSEEPKEVDASSLEATITTLDKEVADQLIKRLITFYPEKSRELQEITSKGKASKAKLDEYTKLLEKELRETALDLIEDAEEKIDQLYQKINDLKDKFVNK